MKLLQKISVGVLLIIGFVGIGVQISSAEIIEKDFGNFTVKIDEKTSIEKNGETGRTDYSIGSVSVSEIQKGNWKDYLNQFNETSMYELKSKNIKSGNTIKIYRDYEAGIGGGPELFVVINAKNFDYVITGEQAVEFSKNITVKNLDYSKSNSYKVFYLNDSAANYNKTCNDRFNEYTVYSAPYTKGVARQALEGLLSKQIDYRDSEELLFPIKYFQIKSLNIKNKVVYVDFRTLKLADYGTAWGNSCSQTQMAKEQIKKTLTQFSTIKDVKITINGVSFDKYFEIKKNIIYDKDYDYEQEGDTTRGCGDYRIKSIEKLQIGSEGRDVGLLQKMLSNLYDIEVNGYFDAFTESAVKKFQIDRKLYPADGIVGKNTRIRLNQYFNNC